jgi:nitrite reductase (NO-forming)
MRKHAFRLLATVFAVALLMAACSSDDGTDGSTDTTTTTPSSSSGGGGGGGEDQAVTIANFAFDPNTLTVPSGQDVTIDLTNEDDVEHSFTLDDDSVSQDVEAGEDSSVTINVTEEIGWHCKYHPTMTGTVTVS